MIARGFPFIRSITEFYLWEQIGRKRERDGINSSTNEKFDSAIIIAYRLILFSSQIFHIFFFFLSFDN